MCSTLQSAWRKILSAGNRGGGPHRFAVPGNFAAEKLGMVLVGTVELTLPEYLGGGTRIIKAGDAFGAGAKLPAAIRVMTTEPSDLLMFTVADLRRVDARNAEVTAQKKLEALKPFVQIRKWPWATVRTPNSLVIITCCVKAKDNSVHVHYIELVPAAFFAQTECEVTQVACSAFVLKTFAHVGSTGT